MSLMLLQIRSQGKFILYQIFRERDLNTRPSVPFDKQTPKLTQRN